MIPACYCACDCSQLVFLTDSIAVLGFYLLWLFFPSMAGMCRDLDLVIIPSLNRVLVAVHLKVWQQKLLFLPQIISLTWRAVRRRIPARTGTSTAARCSVSSLAATYPSDPSRRRSHPPSQPANTVVKSDWGREGLAQGMFALLSSVGAVNSRRGTHILGRESGIRWWKWADNRCLPYKWKTSLLTGLRCYFSPTNKSDSTAAQKLLKFYASISVKDFQQKTSLFQ